MVAAKANIDWKLRADTRDMLTAIDGLNQRLNRMAGSADKASGKAKGIFSDGAKGITQVAGAIAGITGVAGGVMALVNQLRREYEHLVRMQSAAADRQASVGDLRAAALLNRPAGMSVQWLDKLVADVSRSEKVQQERLWPVVSNMLSAKGDVSDRQFSAILRQVGRLGGVGGAMTPMDTIAGAALDLQKHVGGGDPRQGLGWLLQIATNARVVDPQKWSAAVPPVLAAAKPAGWSHEQAAEMFAYLSQSAGDVEGRKSATGTVNFMQTLMKGRTQSGAFIPARGMDGRIVHRPLKASGYAALTELQDWYAQAPEDLRTELLAGFQAEAKIKGGLQSLLARDPKALAAYAQAQKAISSPDAPGLAGMWERYFTGIEAGGGADVRKARRIFGASQEALDLSNPQAVGGEVRKGLRETLQRIPGIGDADIRVKMAEFEARSNFGRTDPTGAAEEIALQMMADKGYGAKFRTRRLGLRALFESSPAGGWAEQLPDGARELGRIPTGENVYAFDDAQGQRWSFAKNRNYNPEAERVLMDLVKAMSELAAEIRESNKASNRKPQPAALVE